MARGYKLCVLASGVDGRVAVRAWTLSTLNVNDQVLALKLMPELSKPWARGWGYLVGDNGFDANPLYLAAAGRGHQLVAPPRNSNRGVRDPRRNSPPRIRGLDHSDSPLRRAGVRERFGKTLLKQRGSIERLFGHSALLGLGPLRPWIRTYQRVHRHVACQLLLLTLRQAQLQLTNVTSAA